MAAPYVAGAYAAFDSYPLSFPIQIPYRINILDFVLTNGPTVMDSRPSGSVSKPRLDMDDSLDDIDAYRTFPDGSGSETNIFVHLPGKSPQQVWGDTRYTNVLATADAYCQVLGYPKSVSHKTDICGEDESVYARYNPGTSSWELERSGSANQCYPLLSEVTCDKSMVPTATSTQNNVFLELPGTSVEKLWAETRYSNVPLRPMPIAGNWVFLRRLPTESMAVVERTKALIYGLTLRMGHGKPVPRAVRIDVTSSWKVLPAMPGYCHWTWAIRRMSELRCLVYRESG